VCIDPGKIMRYCLAASIGFITQRTMISCYGVQI
jgi:hypothetical protein